MKEKIPLKISMHMKMLIEHFKQHNANKCSNIDEIDEYFKKYNLTKLTKDEPQNLNRFIFIKIIEFVVKNLFTQKYLGAGDFNQTRKVLFFKEEIITILQELIQAKRGQDTYLLIL